MNDKIIKANLEEIERHSKEQAELLGLKYLGNGDFKQEGKGELFSEEFWAGAPVSDITCFNEDVPTLIGTMTFQYKRSPNGKIIYTRTLKYKMTTRYKNWYRANMDITVMSAGSRTVKSPDALWQDGHWHNYVRPLDVDANTSGVDAKIDCEFDGTNNDGPAKGQFKFHPA